MMNTKTMALMYCCAGNLKSPSFPLSFPQATILPVKEMVPIIKPATIGTYRPNSTASPTCFKCVHSIMEINAAAKPPIPLKMDTISGIAVIWTLLAIKVPTIVPNTMAINM